MDNADKPINPTDLMYDELTKKMTSEYRNSYSTDHTGGLTKREYFAGLAMQASINSTNSIEFIAERSVKLADQLLLILKKPKP